MKGVNGEQALLAILLLLLTSLATVSGSMPVVESIETFFEEPMHTTHSQEKYVSENFDAGGPTAGGAGVNFGDSDEDEEKFDAHPVAPPITGSLEDEDKFKQKHEKFANCNTREEGFGKHSKDEHFANCANRNEGFVQNGVSVSETKSQKMIIEPFQGSLYSKF
jgi:hypothetical protein